MAITRSETQVQWDTGSNSKAVGAGSSATSDDIALDATCVEAAISLKAEFSSGAPAADDIIYFWLLASSGDPDGASTAEYDTAPQTAETGGGALLLATIDLNVGEVSGTGKMVKRTIPFPNVPIKSRLYAEGLTAGTTNTITVSATIEEMRSG